MQTKRQLKQCTRNVHPSFADFWPGLGVNFHILRTQNWLWESSLSLLSLWCILFQIKLGLFRENLNLKKHLRPKTGWSSPSTFWHRLISNDSWTCSNDSPEPKRRLKIKCPRKTFGEKIRTDQSWDTDGHYWQGFFVVSNSLLLSNFTCVFIIL